MKPYSHTIYAKQILDQRHVGEFVLEDLDVLQMM